MAKKDFGASLEADFSAKIENKNKTFQETIDNQTAEVDRLKKLLEEAEAKVKETEEKASKLTEEVTSKDNKIKKIESMMGKGIHQDKPYLSYASEKITDKNQYKKAIAIAKKLFYSKWADFDTVRQNQRFAPKTVKDTEGYYVFDVDGTTSKPTLEDIDYTKFTIRIPTELLNEANKFSRSQFSSSLGIFLVIQLIKEMYTSPLYEEYRKDNPFFDDKEEILNNPYKFLGETFFG